MIFALVIFGALIFAFAIPVAVKVHHKRRAARFAKELEAGSRRHLLRKSGGFYDVKVKHADRVAGLLKRSVAK